MGKGYHSWGHLEIPLISGSKSTPPRSSTAKNGGIGGRSIRLPIGSQLVTLKRGEVLNFGRAFTSEYLHGNLRVPTPRWKPPEKKIAGLIKGLLTTKAVDV